MGRRDNALSPATLPARQSRNGKPSAAETGVVVLTREQALAVLRRLFQDGCPPANDDLHEAKASMREQLGIDEFAVRF